MQKCDSLDPYYLSSRHEVEQHSTRRFLPPSLSCTPKVFKSGDVVNSAVGRGLVPRVWWPLVLAAELKLTPLFRLGYPALWGVEHEPS